jgi:hypothetical protein
MLPLAVPTQPKTVSHQPGRAAPRKATRAEHTHSTPGAGRGSTSASPPLAAPRPSKVPPDSLQRTINPMSQAAILIDIKQLISTGTAGSRAEWDSSNRVDFRP